MKRFLIELIIFFLCVTVGFIGFFVYLHNKGINSDDYLLEYGEKLEILSNRKDGKRIILFGGSNIAFGVDSKLLSDSLGIDVINYGLHAGIGLRLPTIDLESRLQPGDIVVCMPEYDSFNDNQYLGGESTMPILITLYPEKFINLNCQQMLSFVKASKRTFNALNNPTIFKKDSPSFIYSNKGFDINGDEISHLEYESNNMLNVKKINISFNSDDFKDFMKRMNSFRDDNISVFFIPPCVYKLWYSENYELVEILDEELSKNGFPFISSLEDGVYERDLMFDTYYHLNAKGRIINTQRILNVLKQIVP